MMLASCAIAFTSCKDNGNDSTDETKEVTLAVTGNSGEVITVAGTDVVKDVTIKATENVDRDIEVTLTTDATDGSALLSASKATIAKGSNSATVTITFPASKFPEGAAEKMIKVTATTNADKVAFSPDFTIYNVKGQGGQEAPAILTAVAQALEVNTTDAAGVAVINFTLSKPLDEDITIQTGYGTATDIIDVIGVVWEPATVVIAKNTTSLKVNVTVPKGSKGSLPINFSCENSSVTLDTKSITFQFIVTTLKVSLSPAVTTVDVAGTDVTKVIQVTLSKAVDKDVTVQLTATSSNTLTGTLSAPSVTFTAGGALSQNVNIVFAAADFGNDKDAKVTVTATSDDVEVNAAAATSVFNVSGPSSKQDGQLMYELYRADDDEYMDLTSTITFTDAEKAQGYIAVRVYCEATQPPYNEAGFNPAISFDYEVSGGFDKADIVLVDEEGPFTLVYNGTSEYGYSYFNLMLSAIGKSGKLVFTSTGTTFAPNQGWEVTVN